jgi:hypothetical protein
MLFFQIIKSEAESFNGANAYASAAFDAAFVFVASFAVFHFKNFNGACAGASTATNAFFGVNFNCHFNLLRFQQGSLIYSNVMIIENGTFVK